MKIINQLQRNKQLVRGRWICKKRCNKFNSTVNLNFGLTPYVKKFSVIKLTCKLTEKESLQFLGDSFVSWKFLYQIPSLFISATIKLKLNRFKLNIKCNFKFYNKLKYSVSNWHAVMKRWEFQLVFFLTDT